MLKSIVQTGGGYNPHNGNASRSVTDLEIPGALGTYGLDFTRHWNSVGDMGWNFSWNWTAGIDKIIYNCSGEDGGGPCDAEDEANIYTVTISYPDGRKHKYTHIHICPSGTGSDYNYPWPPDAWGGV